MNHNKNDNIDLEELPKEVVERYCRQMTLSEISSNNQMKLLNSKVLIIGAGGLGSPCLMYLAGSGVGTIGIVDGDVVESSNLHRQVIHSTKNIGINKALSAQMFINNYNPLIKVITHQERFNNKNAYNITKEYDMLIDCSDNPATRYLVNDIAVLLNIPLVSGSAIRFQGQLTVLVTNEINNKINNNNLNNNIGCYRCLFPTPSPALTVGACSEEGVFGPVPGVIGVLQATEALKLIIQLKEGLLCNKMLIYDAVDMKFKVFKIKGKKLNCVICGDKKITSKEWITNFNYEEFCIPSSCKLPKRVILPEKHNIKWNEINDINNNNKIFIDVRPEDQFNFVNTNRKDLLTRINCINIPLDKLNNHIKNNTLPKDKEVYCMCRAGNKSTYAVDLLIKNGYTKVYNIEDGILGYNKLIDSNMPIY